MNCHAEQALDKIRSASAFATGVHLSADEARELSEWIRRAQQELNTPYQCYWRDRALKAETPALHPG